MGSDGFSAGRCLEEISKWITLEPGDVVSLGAFAQKPDHPLRFTDAASEGNQKVVFGLRGMKTNMGDPHRNLVDFAHVPVVKRLTRMPVCVDPSHSVGTRDAASDGILDIMHVTAQGVIAGANMILVDFHPDPVTALVDGPQALLLSELPGFVEDVGIARKAYELRAARAKKDMGAMHPA